MNLWTLLWHVVVVWFTVSIGGGLLLLAVLEARWRLRYRRRFKEMRSHERALSVTGRLT